MRTLTFYSIFMCDLDGKSADEAYPPQTYIVSDSRSEGLRVFANYITPGVWAIGVAPLDEDAKFPIYDISYTMYENGYSTALNMIVPDDFKVEISK